MRETLHGCARTARWACSRALGGACAEAEGPRRSSSAVPAERRIAHCQRVPYHRPAPPALPLRFPPSQQVNRMLQKELDSVKDYLEEETKSKERLELEMSHLRGNIAMLQDEQRVHISEMNICKKEVIY